MTAQESGWSLVLVQEMTELDWHDAEERGVLLNAHLVFADRRFPVVFYDADRIHSTANLGTEFGRPYYEPNVILLPAVTEEAVMAAVQTLAKAQEFDWLLA